MERVSGETYYSCVQEHIFKPAEMTDTGFSTVFDDVPNLALGHTRHIETELGIGPRKVDVSLHLGTSAGGCYSTVRDMLKFSLDLQGHRLLDNKHTELLFTGSESTDGIHIVGHFGGSEGANTKIDIYPDLGYTAVILSNFHEGAKSVWPWLQAALTKRVSPEAVQISSADLQRYAGQYQPQNATRTAACHAGVYITRKGPVKQNH